MGKVRASLVVAVKRGDLVIVGASQFVLPGDYFNVIGHARAEAVLRLRDLLLRQLHSEIRGLHLHACGFDLGQRDFYFLGDLIS
jgi:hypothetical protein